MGPRLRELIPVFDLDGTLVDSDRALVAPFLALGIPEERVSFGLTLEEACAREGIAVDDYLAAYDGALVTPFPGVDALLRALPRWAVCSNKLRDYGRDELERFGWRPDVALFAEDFGGSKTLGPVLEALSVSADDVVFVGDSDHDRVCAREAGARFALAGWNARATPSRDEVLLGRPSDLWEVLALPA